MRARGSGGQHQTCHRAGPFADSVGTLSGSLLSRYGGLSCSASQLDSGGQYTRRSGGPRGVGRRRSATLAVGHWLEPGERQCLATPETESRRRAWCLPHRWWAGAAWRLAQRVIGSHGRISAGRVMAAVLLAVVATTQGAAILGSVGWLTAAGVLLGAVLMAAVGWWLGAAGRPSDGVAGRWIRLCVAALAVEAAFFLPLPPLDWDAMTYHLHLPSRWVQEGHLFHIPTVFGDNAAAFAPQNAALLFAAPMALLGADFTANCTPLLFLLLVSLAVYRLAVQVGVRGGPAVAAAATVWLAAPVQEPG